MATVFAVAISAWGLVAKISLPEQKPLLDSILWFMTWLAALAFGLGAWALAFAEVQAHDARTDMERVLNTSLHGFKVLAAVRNAGGAISDFQLTFVNKAAGEIMGIDYDPFIGGMMLDAGDAPLDAERFETYRMVVDTGEPVSFECHFRKGGVTCWLHSRVAKFDDGVVCSFVDISERKRAEEQVLRSQKLLEMTGRMTHSGGWEMFLPGREVKWSDETYILHEVPEDFEPGFEQCIQFYPSESRERIAAAVEACVLDGTPYDLELEFISAKGRRLWVRSIGRPDFDETGAVQRIYGTFQDITQDKKITLEALESREQLQLALSGTGMGRWDWEIPGDHLEIDEGAARILGFEPAELEPARDFWNSLIHPADLQGVREAVAKHCSGEAPLFDAEYRMRTKDGAWIWVLDRGKGVAMREGTATRMVGTLLDVTARKTLEEERASHLRVLMQAKEEAEKAGRAKADFLAMMSHEIRTPMNAILGFADLLSQKPLSGQEREYVQTITSSGEALLRIIDDILDHSRIESGRLRLENTVFSPEKLLDDICILLTPVVEKKGLGLKVITVGDIPLLVRGDAGRLRQILLNLAGNAVKFTPAGTVAIGVEIDSVDGTDRTDRTDGIDGIDGTGGTGGTKATDGKVALRFFVRDAGPGISLEQAGQIFEPFAQGDSSVSRQYGGTGLGLAISRSLATLMDGVLWFEAQPEGGTTFRLDVSFDLAEENARPELAPTFILDAGFAIKHPLNLMAVDDDEVNLKLIAHVLEKFGYSPLLAGSGEEALGMCRQEWPDCLLLDVQMPGMDGLETTRRLRAMERGQNLPRLFIAALTANVLTTERQACFAVGMSDYLTKPLRKDRLAHVLMQASSQAAMSAAIAKGSPASS